MRVTIHLPDQVGEAYQREADSRDLDLTSVIEDRVLAGAALDPRSRYLILTGQDLTRTEMALGGLQCQTPTILAERAERLARIRFGDHTLALTPGQLEELAWRAQKQGKTIEQMLQIAFDLFAADFFSLVP